MYSVTLARALVAQHYLTVPDPGPEGELHSHTFTIEATLSGPALDEHGYLVDIDELEAAMDATAAIFRDQTLNEMPAFEGKNPSAERLARQFGARLLEQLDPEQATELQITVQEDDVATVGYHTTL